MKKIFLLFVLAIVAWFMFFRPAKAEWQGQLTPKEPKQISENLPLSWNYKEFTVTPKAEYHVKAVVLSKHSYWAGSTEDTLAPYDLVLGWGAMSDAKIINQLKFTQGGRWYNYRWKNEPPLDPSEINSYSSNNHCIPADENVLYMIKHIKKYDVVEMDGYLVDIQNRQKNWFWNSSLSRTDTAGGSCELIWVTRCSIGPRPEETR